MWSWNSSTLFIPFSLYLVIETFTCSCGGTCVCVCVGWKWWHRSGQKALLTTLTDKPTTLKSWHTSHVLWHYVLPHLYCDPLKGSPFNNVCFPPFDTCSVYRLYNNPGCWCAGVGVKVFVIGTRCRYETPYRVIARLFFFTAVSLSDPWTHVTSHPWPHSIDRRVDPPAEEVWAYSYGT